MPSAHILLVDDVRLDTIVKGTVIAVGNGKISDSINIGDKVLYKQGYGTNIKYDEKDVVILDQHDIQAIVED